MIIYHEIILYVKENTAYSYTLTPILLKKKEKKKKKKKEKEKLNQWRYRMSHNSTPY